MSSDASTPIAASKRVARDGGAAELRWPSWSDWPLWLPWALYAATAIATAVTYARLPASELYNTSGSGAAAGLGRALVFVNYSMALMAIAAALVASDRLLTRDAPRRAIVALVVAAIVLCATVAVPGVVDQDDLDARPINALPAVGVALAAGLTLAALVRRPAPSAAPLGGLERLIVLVLAILLVLLAIPWIGATLGFYVDALPAIGPHILAGELLPQSDGSLLAAVHLGLHHGLDGCLLALAALSLWPATRAMTHPRLQRWTALYLAGIFTYGVANALEDFWLEQLVKRGTVDWRIPSVLRPGPDLAWVAMIGAAILLWLVLRRTLLRPAVPEART